MARLAPLLPALMAIACTTSCTCRPPGARGATVRAPRRVVEPEVAAPAGPVRTRDGVYVGSTREGLWDLRVRDDRAAVLTIAVEDPEGAYLSAYAGRFEDGPGREILTFSWRYFALEERVAGSALKHPRLPEDVDPWREGAATTGTVVRRFHVAQDAEESDIALAPAPGDHLYGAHLYGMPPVRLRRVRDR